MLDIPRRCIVSFSRFSFRNLAQSWCGNDKWRGNIVQVFHCTNYFSFLSQILPLVAFGVWDHFRPPSMPSEVLLGLSLLILVSFTHGYLPYGSSDILLPALGAKFAIISITVLLFYLLITWLVGSRYYVDGRIAVYGERPPYFRGELFPLHQNHVGHFRRWNYCSFVCIRIKDNTSDVFSIAFEGSGREKEGAECED